MFRARESVQFTAPYRHPRLIWGIGLNYRDHAADLSEDVPEEPASFIKGDHTIIGPGDPIPLPEQSQHTTSEAEMGIVIGSYCRNVSEEEALDHVFGVVPVLDQTAEDILQAQPEVPDQVQELPRVLLIRPGDRVARRGRVGCRAARGRRSHHRGERDTDEDEHGFKHALPTVVPDQLPQQGDAAVPRRHHLARHARSHPCHAG